MGTVEDWPVSVSILTQYGDSDCCISGVMRHTPFRMTKMAGKNLSILAHPAQPGAIRCDSMGQGRAYPTPSLFLVDAEVTMNLQLSRSFGPLLTQY
jgi:hypothetical protein